MFAILVIMALFTTFMTTPILMAIYKPARGTSSRLNHGSQRGREKSAAIEKNEQDELHVLACVHGPGNSPSLIKLIELARPTKNSTTKLYVMHLVELTERPSSIVMVRLVRRNGFPWINGFKSRRASHDQVMAAFEAYGQLGRVTVRPTTAISALPTMHEDICHVAEEKRVEMIILPFHKQWRGGESGVGGVEEVENVGHGWRMVNQRVLENAPCSVAVLVDRGFGANDLQQDSGPTNTVRKRVCIIFVGGPDDREGLELGGRMAEHPAVRVTVKRFVPRTTRLAGINSEREQELDDEAVANFQRRWDGMSELVETTTNNLMEGVLAIGRSREYDLLIVGKGQFPPGTDAELADHEAEHVELGPIGDLLASSGRGIVPSVLVIQRHELDKDPASKIIRNKDVAAFV